MTDRKLTDCAETCHECVDACLELIPHCLKHCADQGRPVETEHLNTLMDCAEICSTTHSFLHRGSSHHAAACAACAAVCEACAKCCEELGVEDEPTRACAEACRACAESCHSMA